MVVQVRLHSILQHTLPDGQSQVVLELPEGAVVSSVLDQLGISLAPSAMVMVINLKVVGEYTPLADGDQLDLFPAVSGG